ncbi:MAG: hypothetical protein NC331_05545 [Lachnospiraceae bacterium]|nr:hypothetical protein [Lachnospiraceae bacterium]
MRNDQPLSDAEIRVRAMELGMVSGDSRTLTAVQDSQSSGISNVPDGTPEVTSTATPEPTPSPTPDPLKPLPMVTLKPPTTPEPEVDVSIPTPMDEPTPEQQESVTFVIQSGQSSYTVSKSLAEAGLVEDASEFDRYLEANGYSKRISTGTYEIPVNATEEEIAKIITRSR